jgi:hypothetical protein
MHAQKPAQAEPCIFKDATIFDHFIKSADEDQILLALEGPDQALLMAWISEPNKQGLFLVAAGRHQWRVLQRMVELGHDPFVRDHSDDTALTMALLLHERDAEAEHKTVSYLFELGLATARGAQDLSLPLVYTLLSRAWLSDGPVTWLKRAVASGLDIALANASSGISELGFLVRERMDADLAFIVDGDWVDLPTVSGLHDEIQRMLHPGDNDNRLFLSRAAIERRLLQAKTNEAAETVCLRRI